MEQQEFEWPDVIVPVQDLREWVTALDRFVTGIEDAALGQGEPIDSRKLLSDFKEAQGRSRPRLLAARHQTSSEADEVFYPTEQLDELLGAWGLIEIIDAAAVREEQGEPVDPDQLMRELTEALFSPDEETEEAEDDRMPASFAAAPLSMSAPAAARAGPRKINFYVRMAKKEKAWTQWCCQKVPASTRKKAHTKMARWGSKRPEFLVVMGRPEKNKPCKRRGVDKERRCRR